MKKRLLSLCLALPIFVAFAGCNTSETPTAPNGGKAADNSKDVVPPKPPEKTKGPTGGTIAAP